MRRGGEAGGGGTRQRRRAGRRSATTAVRASSASVQEKLTAGLTAEVSQPRVGGARHADLLHGLASFAFPSGHLPGHIGEEVVALVRPVQGRPTPPMKLTGPSTLTINFAVSSKYRSFTSSLMSSSWFCVKESHVTTCVS
ncbi:hypothetical protein ZWY2020_000322 [Hordeum vulgare]|nr:hypothetical protein ZWY2020_000322 [Hordeum vulgare]